MNKNRRALLALIFAAIAVVPPALALAAPPANDDFASAQALAPSFGEVLGDIREATEQQAAGEPDHAASGFGAAHSVWYRWTPPGDGAYRLDTCGSSFDTRIAVYSGADLASLTEEAANNDSTGSNCGGTKASELVTPLLDDANEYFIAVDTMGPLPECADQPHGPFRLRLEAPSGAEQMPCPGAGGGPATNPGTRVPGRTADFQVPKLSPKGTEFSGLAELNKFTSELRGLGVQTVVDADANSSKGAETKAQRNWLREHGGSAEILRASFDLTRPDGSNAVELEEGEQYRIATDQGVVRIDVDFFDLASDLKAIKDEKAELEREAKRRAEEERKKSEQKEAKSRCGPIAAGESNKQIAARFPKSREGYTTYNDAIVELSKLGCDVLVDKYVRGKPSAPHAYVKEVTRTDPKAATVYVALAQPGSHDFVFTVRENPAEFVSQATNANIPIGTDGNLTFSKKQLNRVTVQVIERATGRLVAGIDVGFVGKDGEYESRLTNGDGEVTFTPKIVPEDQKDKSRTYRLSASYMDMEGWRTIKAVDRKDAAFTSMAGRRITRSSKGIYGGANPAELEFAKSLPVVPANLGSGAVGEVSSVPVVRQADVLTFNASGDQFRGQYNTLSVPNNSDYLVGAAPGLVAAAGGDAAQAARPVNRAGIPNPLDFLKAIVSPLTKAIDAGVANIRTALSGAHQALIAQTSNLIGQAGGNLISDKGLGVISTGGGNLIGQAGGNLISDKGLGVRDVGDAKIISDNGGSLITDNGGGLISENGLGLVAAQGDAMSLHGGRVISTGGGN